jgi:hypothetical protein
MLSVIMLSVIMLSVIMLSVIMLSVIMLSVMATVNGPMWLPYDNFRTILNSLSPGASGRIKTLVLGLWVNYYTTVLTMAQ